MALFYPMKIRLQNISRSFGGLKAVDAISFETGGNECFFLLGPSGCGKTTVLRIIAGFCRPDAGLILFDNEPVNNVAAHLRNAGMVFQNYALWPHLTVEENIAFGLTVPAHRVSKTEKNNRVRQMIDLLHLNGTEKRLPSQLSGGQQQRVALARALAVKPACLLLDEPLSNLDAKLRMEMRLELKHIIKQMAVTAVYVTHDQVEALSMADRCAIMRNGRIEQIGAPRELYEQPAGRFVADFMGCANLFAATVVARDQNILQIANSAGVWLSQNTGRAYPQGAKVAMAIRAENVRLGTGTQKKTNSFLSRLKEKIYLGTTVEYRLELEGGAILKSQQIAGSQNDVAPSGQIPLWVDPRDVIVLPPD